MLRELLELIASGRGGTGESVAAALGLKPSQVEEMLIRLAALGYIEDFAASCGSCREASCADGKEKSSGRGSSCAGCSMSAACNFGAKAHVWTLTAKGKASLKADSSSMARDL